MNTTTTSAAVLERWRAHAARAYDYRVTERPGTETPDEVDALYARLAKDDVLSAGCRHGR